MLKRLSEGLGDWDEYIAPTLFAYWTSHIENVGVTPDILTYGRSIRLPDEAVKRESMWDRVKHMVTQVPIFKEQAIDKLIQLQEKMKQKNNVKQRSFKLGQQVLIKKETFSL